MKQNSSGTIFGESILRQICYTRKRKNKLKLSLSNVILPWGWNVRQLIGAKQTWPRTSSYCFGRRKQRQNVTTKTKTNTKPANRCKTNSFVCTLQFRDQIWIRTSGKYHVSMPFIRIKKNAQWNTAFVHYWNFGNNRERIGGLRTDQNCNALFIIE